MWKEKLSNWSNGIDLPVFPSYMKKQFLYETSPIVLSRENEICGLYIENFIENDILNEQTEDYSSFLEFLENPENKYCTSFCNLSGTSKLIIPTKIGKKKYTSIKLFMDNAPDIQKVELWKMVAKEAMNMLTKYKKIWISTHGTGVSYLHVRIDTVPKYYKTRQFKTM